MTIEKKFITGIVVVAVVGVLLGFFLTGGSNSPTVANNATQDDIRGGSVRGVDQYTDGISYGGGRLVFNTVSGMLEANEQKDTESWYNDTGHGAVVTHAEIWVPDTGAASSSLNYWVVATSSNSIPDDMDFTPADVGAYTATSTAMDQVRIATGTTMTATSSYSNANASQGNIFVPENWYVHVYRQAENGQVCTGASCETATSSNIGYDAHWMFDYRYEQRR